MISSTFRKFIDTHRTGLGIIELPTSIGKTFSTNECIAKYVRDWAEYKKNHKRNGEFRQIIVVTTLKKNLTGLDDAYRRLGRADAYEEEVMFLDNLKEILKSNISLLAGRDCTIPNYIANLHSFRELKNKVDLILNGEKFQLPQEIQNKISLEANRFYLDLRKQIANAYKEYNKLNHKIDLATIADEENYEWLFKLFPDLLIPRKKVLLMSFKKLLDGRIYEKPSCAFMSAKFLKDKIIFIDEFDGTKQTIKDSLAEEQNENKVDFLQLYNTIYSGAQNRWSSDALYGIDKQLKGSLFNLEKIKKNGDELRKKYLLDHAYQTDENLRDDSHTFIFKDAATRTISQETSNIQVVARDIGENRVGLSLRMRNDMQEGDFYLDSVVRWVTGYLKAFASYAMNMAKGYENKQNQESKGTTTAILSTEEAFRTFLYQYGISRNEPLVNSQTKLLMKMADVSSSLSRRRHTKEGIGYDYYTQGFTYYSMEDGHHHNDNTIISMVDIPITAEGRLATMSTYALVLGLSATAGIPSVTGNYNLRWLEEKIDNYHDIVEEEVSLREEVTEFLSQRYQPYNNGQIEIKVNVIDNIQENKPANFLKGESRRNPCIALSTFSSEVASGIESMLKDVTDNYTLLRYYSLATVMRDFACQKGLQSLLYLGSKNAEGTLEEPSVRTTFDKYIIERIAKAVNKDLGLQGEDAINVAFIYSVNFDETLANMRMRLSDIDADGNHKNPERLIIISSYYSVGIGQNMQYPAPNKYKKNLIHLVPRGDVTENTYRDKDIDAIYLGDITHLATVFGQDKISEKDLILNIFQAEELWANGEIMPEEKDANIREAFRHLNNTYGRKNIIQYSESIRSQLTRMVIQGVGRIGRSNQRPQNINIYIDKSVLNKLHPETLDRRFSTPEMKKIYESYKDNECNSYASEYDKILIQSATLSDLATEDIYKLLNSSKTVGWMPDDIQRWEEWREIVLKHPTATQEEYDNNPFLKAYYISNGGQPVDKYLFSANNRYYGHQHVWFGDRESFIRQPAKFRPFKDIDGNGYSILTMSEENANLQTILKYPGLRKWWHNKGYAERFTANPYIVSPVLYTEILKGAYGEMAGRFIIWQEVKQHLIRIEDPYKYEIADFQIKGRPEEYVDFKYYTPATIKDNDVVIKDLIKKINRLEASRLYIINVVKGGNKELYEPVERYFEGRIIVLPWLIDKDGVPNPDIKKIFL